MDVAVKGTIDRRVRAVKGTIDRRVRAVKGTIDRRGRRVKRVGELSDAYTTPPSAIGAIERAIAPMARLGDDDRRSCA